MLREPITSGRERFYHALRVGHVPSWLVAGTFIGTFAFVIGITIYVSKKSSGEITEFGAHRSLWRILINVIPSGSRGIPSRKR